MLGLSSWALLVDHKNARHYAREIRSIVALQHVKREVDPRAVAGGGPDGSVHDGDAIRLQSHLREAGLQVFREKPLRGHSAIAEHPRIRKREHARNEARNHAFRGP